MLRTEKSMKMESCPGLGAKEEKCISPTSTWEQRGKVYFPNICFLRLSLHFSHVELNVNCAEAAPCLLFLFPGYSTLGSPQAHAFLLLHCLQCFHHF